jgi:hypothetical protein
VTTLAAAKRVARGGCPPRYGTPRSPERATLGPRVAEVARALGTPLMPHQRNMLDVALEINPETGYLAYPEVVFVGPRQATGKTFTTLPLMTHRCMGFTADLAAWVSREYGIRIPPPGPQRVLFLAQTADDARVKWRRVHLARLLASRYTRNQFTATLTQNKEAFTWANGSIWTPGSATALTAGTGDTLDLAILDEYWSHKTNRAELGVRPAMMTRPWRQLWKCSMVPGLSRVMPDEWKPLRAAMTAGRARVEAGIREGVAYFEFSAEEGLDPGDPTTWWSCLPAMGSGTVSERTVREDYDHFREDGRLIDFEAEYLGWAPKASTPRWLVIGERAWTDRHDPNSRPLDPIALGVASTQTRSYSSIGLAALREDGDVHGELIDRRPGVDWVPARLMELIESWEVCAITINPAGQESSVIDETLALMDRAGHTMPLFKPSLREMCAASARVLDASGEPLEEPVILDDDTEYTPVGLWHLGQAELNRAVASVVKRMSGAALWEFDLGGPTDPLRAITAAWWGGVKVDWPGSGYDIRGSLG